MATKIVIAMATAIMAALIAPSYSQGDMNVTHTNWNNSTPHWTTAPSNNSSHNCHMEHLTNCMKEAVHGYDIHTQCNFTSQARMCLVNLHSVCTNWTIKEKIERDAIPWLDRRARDCDTLMNRLHGNGTYGGNHSTSQHMCRRDHVVQCMYNMTTGYNMEHQCSAVENVRRCLMGLMILCDDYQVKNHIRWEATPMLDRKMNSCRMYGHKTSHEQNPYCQDGYVRGDTGAAVETKPSIFAVLATVAMASVASFRRF